MTGGVGNQDHQDGKAALAVVARRKVDEHLALARIAELVLGENATRKTGKLDPSAQHRATIARAL
jgi:hypothetical protein